MIRIKRLSIVFGAYIAGVALGVLASEKVYHQIIAHPHQIPALDIIQHNIAVLALMLLGTMTFGTITLIVLLVNGTTLGVVVGSYTLQGKFAAILLTLAPHGVLEISAFLLAGYGDLLMVSLLWQLIRTKGWSVLKQQRSLFWKCLLMNGIAVIMLVIAGYIEHSLFLTVL
jgi:stage II sporulation protein M